jgi:DNA recombination protein RmuC
MEIHALWWGGTLVGFAGGYLFSRFWTKQQFRTLTEQRYHLQTQEAILQERLKNKEELLFQFQEKLQKHEKETLLLQEQLQTQHHKQIESQTRLQVEREQFNEKIREFHEHKNQLKTEFHYFVQSAFEEKSQTFSTQNQHYLQELLSPLREQLGTFKQKVEEVYEKDSRDRISLYQEIQALKDLNYQMSREAFNLTTALKGDSRFQGAWGEFVLEKILERSGLREGEEYEVQKNFSTEEGKRYRPDVLIRLPKGRDIIIDAKVSLKAYEQYQCAETETERKNALKEHIHSIRQHLQNLSAKNYETLSPLRSLDFVLMFVPIEAALFIALEAENQLFYSALELRIMLVTPSTLMMTLRIIQNLWNSEQQSQHIETIARHAASLYERFAGFTETLEEVGKHLDRAKKAHYSAQSQLTQGKENLVKQAQELTRFGISPKKKISDTLIQESNSGSLFDSL